jgi:Family of unknown function (DUF5343)
MSSLPYISAPGNIAKALTAIGKASTPESVSQDFVKTILGIKGGSGNQVTSFLKKIGFAAADGKPTDVYNSFKNKAKAGAAIAAALKAGYGPLYKRNEYMHRLSDDDLKGLVIEETGAGEDTSVPALIVGCISALKSFANFSETQLVRADAVIDKPEPEESKSNGSSSNQQATAQGLGMNLSYTINLNLPATSDIAVFNAIFKSLKENLL